MVRRQWRRQLVHGVPHAALADWLSEPDSLTARCQRHCGAFRVHLLRSGLLRSIDDAADRRRLVQGREVLLECDGVPVIFAHSELLTAPFGGVTNGRLTRWLAGLASRSLGSLLFTYPGFKREPLEFRQLDARHPLYRRAVVWADEAPELWARRSVHRLGQQSLCVTEVFLPAILRLGK